MVVGIAFDSDVQPYVLKHHDHHHHHHGYGAYNAVESCVVSPSSGGRSDKRRRRDNCPFIPIPRPGELKGDSMLMGGVVGSGNGSGDASCCSLSPSSLLDSSSSFFDNYNMGKCYMGRSTMEEQQLLCYGTTSSPQEYSSGTGNVSYHNNVMMSPTSYIHIQPDSSSSIVQSSYHDSGLWGDSPTTTTASVQQLAGAPPPPSASYHYMTKPPNEVMVDNSLHFNYSSNNSTNNNPPSPILLPATAAAAAAALGGGGGHEPCPVTVAETVTSVTPNNNNSSNTTESPTNDTPYLIEIDDNNSDPSLPNRRNGDATSTTATSSSSGTSPTQIRCHLNAAKTSTIVNTKRQNDPPVVVVSSDTAPPDYEGDTSNNSAQPGNATPEWCRRPNIEDGVLEELCDLRKFMGSDKYNKLMVDYCEGISFPLGEGGRELLRACLNAKGCKGKKLQGASVPVLLQLAYDWGLWNIALRIKIERATGELCPSHDAFVRFKATQSQLRKYVRREFMQTERDMSGKIRGIQFEEMKSLTLGKEGRETLRTQLRRLHDKHPDQMDNLLDMHGFKYSELRNATVSQLIKMAYICNLWEGVVEACRKQEEKRESSRYAVGGGAGVDQSGSEPAKLDPFVKLEVTDSNSTIGDGRQSVPYGDVSGEATASSSSNGCLASSVPDASTSFLNPDDILIGGELPNSVDVSSNLMKTNHHSANENFKFARPSSSSSSSSSDSSSNNRRKQQKLLPQRGTSTPSFSGGTEQQPSSSSLGAAKGFKENVGSTNNENDDESDEIDIDTISKIFAELDAVQKQKQLPSILKRLVNDFASCVMNGNDDDDTDDDGDGCEDDDDEDVLNISGCCCSDVEVVDNMSHVEIVTDARL